MVNKTTKKGGLKKENAKYNPQPKKAEEPKAVH